ncbi:terminase large subunit domain-containing protein [Escherichia coli]|uniref:terminase large subunit domain-containing protein n=1 Tax=Escherichia coli TaxID=562 RepID=UPI002989B0C4|nr:terminase large subunit [Escherichia coli]
MSRKSYPNVNAANQYARDVVRGKIIACQFVIQACQRHLDDLMAEKSKSFRYRFDKDLAERAAKFIQLLPHTKGEWAFKRMPITLEPWQLFVICCAFGWVNKGTRLRRFREVYTEIPRKNGKSAISAGVALYCFACDNEFGAEVYSGATTEKQAWEVFRPARLMCKRTPMLTEAFGIEVNASNMNRPEDGARFEPLIGNPGDGSSPHCAVVDEYHEHATDALYTTMLTGMGARRQPLMWAIKFGAGKNGFTRGNPQTGTPATDLDDDYFDMLQEELCSVVEASGASLEKGRHDQLLTALRALLLSRKNPFGDIKSDGTVQTALENLGLGEARYIIQRGANANGAWIRWSDGAIEVFGTGGSNDNGLAKVVYPIALPKLSRFISIAERIRTDYGSTSNNVHVSMIVDDQVTNTGFYVRCQMYDGKPSTSAFSWRVYCAPV